LPLAFSSQPGMMPARRGRRIDSMSRDDFLTRALRGIIRRRILVVILWALILPPSIYFAVKVQQDNSIDRLIVQSDPDAVAAREFEKVFGVGEYVVILAESNDPFALENLKAFADLEDKLSKLDRVTANSALSIYKRAKAGFEATPESADAFRKFATGTDLFRRQGLVGKTFLAIPLVLAVKTSQERHDVVAAIDVTIAPLEANPKPFTALRKVGQPYVNAYLDTDTRQSGFRLFPVFFLFVVVLNYALYRSFRTLFAIVIVLGVSAATTVGFVGITGGTFTIVSQVVPMTILITATATLVYLHSRYVEKPPGVDQDEHLVHAFRHKFLATTASMFAAAVGFAALAESKIRPIRELGYWIAVGIVFTWIAVFTLFPALEKLLRCPTSDERKTAAPWFVKFTEWLPTWSYRYRWVLVPGFLLFSAAGAVALFGLPSVVTPMELQTNPLEYIDHESQLYKDTKRLESVIGGLGITEVWVTPKPGKEKTGVITDAEVLRGLNRFSLALEKDKRVGAAVGMPAILRTQRYVSGEGDQLPDDDAGMEKVAASLETLLEKEPLLRRFLDDKQSQTHIPVITETLDYKRFVEIDRLIQDTWAATQKSDPALADLQIHTVGLGPLQAKISYYMVPTLVRSFALTVAIIFVAFLLVFRSGAARLMAMIPSIFAILAMFGFMRLTGMFLNVATILIASTVLGTSENDQIHFFYHYGEKAKESTEAGLRHTLLISGKAIFYATMINAGGFLAFALARLPPIRQFGILSSLAFVLSMLADFTALPAALWLVYRDKPEALKEPKSASSTEASEPGA
jgi:hypothetical protein